MADSNIPETTSSDSSDATGTTVADASTKLVTSGMQDISFMLAGLDEMYSRPHSETHKKIATALEILGRWVAKQDQDLFSLVPMAGTPDAMARLLVWVMGEDAQLTAFQPDKIIDQCCNALANLPFPTDVFLDVQDATSDDADVD